MQAEVTALLLRWSAGDRQALDRLLPLLYDQLKHLAHARLRHERAGHTLNTTALVHEAYLRLVHIERVQWHDRAHFLAMAARVMRRVLLDAAHGAEARRRRPPRGARGGAPAALAGAGRDAPGVRRWPAAARGGLPAEEPGGGVRYFGGLTLEEVAAVLGVSPPTVMRDVRFAEAWLAQEWGGT